MFISNVYLPVRSRLKENLLIVISTVYADESDYQRVLCENRTNFEAEQTLSRYIEQGDVDNRRVSRLNGIT